MKIQVRLTILSGDNKKLLAYKQALGPDNRGFPPGIGFKEHASGNMLVYVIEAPFENVKSLRNTVDDLLEHLEAAERALSEVRSRDESQ